MVIRQHYILCGRRGRKVVENARKKIAKSINASNEEIYFTSCGSESDNLAIKGIMFANKLKGKHMITSKIEHPAVLNTCRWLENNGFEVTYLSVDCNGKISLKELEDSIRNDTVLISIMSANNEIGTIQPIEQIGKIAKSKGVVFHTDAVQAMGNMLLDVKKMNVDALSMSGHKLYAPKGVGALYVNSDIKFEQIQHGGHQEKNKRAGTENVPSILAIGEAVELLYSDFEEHNKKLQNLRDFFISEIESKICDVRLNGDRFDRLPGNANFSFKNVDASQLLLYLDSFGICASAGSACTAGSAEPSHVLLAIGLKEEYIQGALRVTFGIDNTIEDVKYLVDKIKCGVEKYRADNT